MVFLGVSKWVQKNTCKAAFYAAQRFKSRSFFKCCFCCYMFDMLNIITMVYVPIRTTGRLQFRTPAAGNTHPPKYSDEVTEHAQTTPSFFGWVLVGCVPPGRRAQVCGLLVGSFLYLRPLGGVWGWKSRKCISFGRTKELRDTAFEINQ